MSKGTLFLGASGLDGSDGFVDITGYSIVSVLTGSTDTFRVSGDIVLTGNVDGRDVATDGTLLDNTVVKVDSNTEDIAVVAAASGDWENVEQHVRAASGSWGDSNPKGESVFTTVLGNSGLWEDNRADVAIIAAASADWNNVDQTVRSASALWDENKLDLSTLAVASADWENNFTTLNANSAIWDQNERDISALAVASADWEVNREDISILAVASGQWNSTESTVNANSGTWTWVADNSGSVSTLDSVFATVRTNSGGWTATDGDTITSTEWSGGVLTLKQKDNGELTTTLDDGTFVSSWNLKGDKVGSLSVIDSNTITISGVPGHISSVLNSKELTLDAPFWSTVHDNSATWTWVAENSGNNNNLTSVYGTVCAASADWNNTEITVRSNSGQWEDVFASVTSQSADWQNTFITLSSVSGIWDNDHTTLNINSGDWENNFATLNANSATWTWVADNSGSVSALDSVFSTVRTSSSQWNSTESTVNVNSANWGFDSSDVRANSGIWNNDHTVLYANSGLWNINKLDLAEVAVASGEWDIAKSTVATNSSYWSDHLDLRLLYETKLVTPAASAIKFTGPGVGCIDVDNTGTVVVEITGGGGTVAAWTKNGSQLYYNTGNVGVNTEAPNERFTVGGNISAANIIYDKDGNSTQWTQGWKDGITSASFTGGVVTFQQRDGTNVGVSIDGRYMSSWNIEADSGGTSTVSDNENAKIAGDKGIVTSQSSKTVTISAPFWDTINANSATWTWVAENSGYEDNRADVAIIAAASADWDSVYSHVNITSGAFLSAGYIPLWLPNVTCGYSSTATWEDDDTVAIARQIHETESIAKTFAFTVTEAGNHKFVGQFKGWRSQMPGDNYAVYARMEVNGSLVDGEDNGGFVNNTYKDFTLIGSELSVGDSIVIKVRVIKPSQWEQTYPTLYWQNVSMQVDACVDDPTKPVKHGNSIITDDSNIGGQTITVYGDVSARGGLSANEIVLGGTKITATAAELNILDGVTATAAELNILDGVTASAAELNILDGATLTTTELNYVDGVTSAIQPQLDTAIGGITNVAEVSSDWNDVYTTTVHESGKWATGYTKSLLNEHGLSYLRDTSAVWTTVNVNSGDWSESGKLAQVFTTVTENSGQWKDSYIWSQRNRFDIVNVADTSGKWDSTYSTLCANSADWATNTASILTNTANIAINTADISNVAAASSQWDSTYSTLCANSAGWSSTETTVHTQSAEWVNATTGGVAGGWTNEGAVAGGDSTWSSVVFRHHFNHLIDDDKSNNDHTVTAYGGAAIVGTPVKWGAGSLHLDGVDDYVEIPDSPDWDFGTGDFTIEFWFRLKDQDGYNWLLNRNSSIAAGYGHRKFVVIASGDKILFYGAGSLVGGQHPAITGGTSTTEINKWHHCALVRESNVTSLYLDGISQGSVADTQDHNYSDPIQIGAGQGQWAHTYIDDFRITKGLARTITVPTEAYPVGATTEGGNVKLAVNTNQLTVGVDKPVAGTQITLGKTSSYDTLLSGRGDVVFTDNLTVSGTIFTIDGNSDNWKSAHTTLASNSAVWEQNRANFASSSAKWDNTLTTVNTFSSQWDENRLDLATIATGSAVWDSDHTTLYANSAQWEAWKVHTDSEIYTLSSVAIGTVSPNAALAVMGDISAVGSVSSKDLFLGHPGASGYVACIHSQGDLILSAGDTGNTPAASIHFVTPGTYGARSNWATMHDNGNWTISHRRNDFHKLTVGGHISATGNVYTSGGQLIEGITVSGADTVATKITTIMVSGSEIVDNGDGTVVINHSGKLRNMSELATISSRWNSAHATVSGVSGQWDHVSGWVNESTVEDPYWSNVVLRLPFDGCINDDKSNTQHTVNSTGHVVLSGSNKRFGSHSVAFDGTGDYLTVPGSSDFAMGTGDFTVEFWVYVATSGDVNPNDGLVSIYHPNDEWFAELAPAGSNTYGFYNGTAHQDTGVTIKYGEWVHYAVVRSGTGTNETKIYIDGDETVAFTMADNFGSDNQVFIGNVWDSNSLYHFKGQLDDLRITKGVARYTSSFERPTKPLPISSSTDCRVVKLAGNRNQIAIGTENVPGDTKVVITDTGGYHDALTVQGNAMFTDNLTVSGLVITPCGNSEQWCSAFSTTNSYSAQWDENRLDLSTLALASAGWDSIETTLRANSATWATNTADIATNVTNIATNVTDIATNAVNISANTADIAVVAVVSGQWDLAEETVNAGSAQWWSVESIVNANSADWTWVAQNSGSDEKLQNVFTSVTDNSSNWTIGHTDSQINKADISNIALLSASWNTAYITATADELDISTVAENSGVWDSVHTTVLENSGLWEDNREDVAILAAVSSDWNNTFNTLYSVSADWDSDHTTVNAYSGSWGSATEVWTTVNTNSAQWDAASHTDLGDIPTTSGQWNSTESTVNANSASWGGIDAASEIASSVNTTVNANSSNWNYVLSNSATIYEDLTVHGDISAQGDLNVENAYVEDTIYSKGDTDTYIVFSNDQIDFWAGGERLLKLDEAADDEVVIGDSGHVNFRAATQGYGYTLYAKSDNDDGVNNSVGVRNSSPQAVFHVKGDMLATGDLVGGVSGNIVAENYLSAGSIIYAFDGHSTLWNSAWTNLNTNSSQWNSTETTVNANSSDWQNTFNTLSSVSAIWDDLTTTVSTYSSEWHGCVGTETTLNEGSAQWTAAWTHLNATSAQWNINREDIDSIVTISADWHSDHTTVNANSAQWEDAFATAHTNSARWNNSYSSTNQLSSLIATNSGAWKQPLSARSIGETVLITKNPALDNQVLKAVYKAVDGTYQLACANKSISADVVGVVVDSTNQLEADIVYTGWAGCNTTTNWPVSDIGETMYLSDDPTLPGVLQITAPTTVGSISKPIGVVLDTNGTDSTTFLVQNLRGIELESVVIPGLAAGWELDAVNDKVRTTEGANYSVSINTVACPERLTVKGGISASEGLSLGGTLCAAKIRTSGVYEHGQYAQTPALDFDEASIQTYPDGLEGGSWSPTTANRSAGAGMAVKVTFNYNTVLVFPNDWVFLGSKPGAIGAGKVGVLTLQCFGPNESDIVAAFGAQD